MASSWLDVGDGEIISRIKAGDSKTFELLFRSYWQLLVEFAEVYTHDSDNAKEIVAEFFAGLWQRREKFEVQTTVEAYLYWSVRNRAWNARRNEARKDEIHDLILQESAPLDTGSEDYRMESVTRALDTLPERYREVITLRWFHQMDVEQIASILGISVQNSYKLSNRALQALKRATVQNERAGGS